MKNRNRGAFGIVETKFIATTGQRDASG